MFRRYLELVFNTTDPATFTDTNGKPLGPPKAVSDYIAALAKGGASAALVYADLARVLDQAAKAVTLAGTARGGGK
jgi:hypothetical protein